jgi:hypothetical protein
MSLPIKFNSLAIRDWQNRMLPDAKIRHSFPFFCP